jgi:hypothetical protein
MYLSHVHEPCSLVFVSCSKPSSSPDVVGVDRTSICLESSLSSGAYNLVLHGLVQRSPGVSIVHVPADRTFAWSQLPADELPATVQQWWAEVGQPDAQYVLFHCTDDAHYCALLLDVAV